MVMLDRSNFMDAIIMPEIEVKTVEDFNRLFELFKLEMQHSFARMDELDQRFEQAMARMDERDQRFQALLRDVQTPL